MRLLDTGATGGYTFENAWLANRRHAPLTTSSGARLVREVKSRTRYFGVGDLGCDVGVEVRWPDGATSATSLAYRRSRAASASSSRQQDPTDPLHAS